MKRITAFLAVFVCLLTAASCGKQNSDSSQSESTQNESTLSSLTVPLQQAEPSVLQNKMTDTEQSRVKKRALTLLDSSAEDTEHQVTALTGSINPEEQLQYLQEQQEQQQIFFIGKFHN